MWVLWEASSSECGGKAQGWALSQCPVLPPSLQGTEAAPGTSSVPIAGGRFHQQVLLSCWGRKGKMLGMWLAVPRAWDLLVALGMGQNPNFPAGCQRTSVHRWSRGWKYTSVPGRCVGAGWVSARALGSREGCMWGHPHMMTECCVWGGDGSQQLRVIKHCLREEEEEGLWCQHTAGGTSGIGVSDSLK